MNLAFQILVDIYTVSQKNSQNCFHQNFVECPPTLIIFGTKMAKTVELCKVYSFSTSPDLCQHTSDYRVKPRCSQLLHNAVIISIRLLTFASPIRQWVIRDLIILWYLIFYAKNSINRDKYYFQFFICQQCKNIFFKGG